jgi:hypothetical protein
MTNINKDKLEDALNSKEEKKPQVSKEMEIGFHQGAFNTLINERNEMIRMIQQIEQVMQAHMKRLEELGVKIKTGERKE